MYIKMHGSQNVKFVCIDTKLCISDYSIQWELKLMKYNMAQTRLLTKACVRNFFGLYTFLVVFLDCRLNTFRKTEKKPSVLRTGIRKHNINPALWITTPIYNYYKHLEIVTTNSEVLHPLMSYYIQLNEKTEPRYRTYNMCEIQALIGSVRLMTSQQSEQVHVSHALRPEALFGKTHVSYSLPPLTAQLVLIETAPCGMKRENCSQRFVFCSKTNRKIRTLK
jgi:predicted DNA-binding protein with PD1-like motif